MLEAYQSTLAVQLGKIAHRTGNSLQPDHSNSLIKNDADAIKFWSRENQQGLKPEI